MEPVTARSRWLVALVFAWLALGALVSFHVVHAEGFRGDAASLEFLAFVAVSAVLGSRLWLAVDTRRHVAS